MNICHVYKDLNVSQKIGCENKQSFVKLVQY